MKILLVISKFHPEYTGAAHRLDQMYRRLQKHHPDLKIGVLCNSTVYMRSENYEHDGWNVERCVFPLKLSFLPTRARNAIKVYYEFCGTMLRLMRQKPDVVHTAGYSGGTMAALLYARQKNIPRLVELVTKNALPLQFLPGLRYRKALALEKQTIIIAISQQIADGCHKIGLQKNVWARPNPVNEMQFFLDSDKKQNYRKALSHFHKTDIVIAMVAKFMPQKNQIFLLDVIQNLPDIFKILLAGPIVESGIYRTRDQAYFDELLQKAKLLKLEDRIHICTGFVNASAYMKASDIYAMPQYSEGLGTPMLEAIACGLPVVANKDEAAFCEWIKDGENGFLRPLQPQEWAEAFIAATKISELQRQKSSNQILGIAKTQKIDEQYMKIIDKLLQSSAEDVLEVEQIIK